MLTNSVFRRIVYIGLQKQIMKCVSLLGFTKWRKGIVFVYLPRGHCVRRRPVRQMSQWIYCHRRVHFYVSGGGTPITLHDITLTTEYSNYSASIHNSPANTKTAHFSVLYF